MVGRAASGLGVAALAVLTAAVPVSAQVAWEAPALVAPAAPAGLALFLVDASPGSGLGALAAYRTQRGDLTVGYRAFLGEGAGDELALAGGVTVSGPLAHSVEEADVEVMWWGGVGAGVGSDLLVSLPVGLVVGWTGEGDGVLFAPYAGAHVALDLATGTGSGADLDGAVDVGLDLTLTSGWVVRVAATFGGREALAVGMRVPVR